MLGKYQWVTTPILENVGKKLKMDPIGVPTVKKVVVTCPRLAALGPRGTEKVLLFGVLTIRVK